ncbi:MAG: hypothetical protein RLY86_715 [Pseudomonadota bacterium]|jgi:hypothetical protein
MELAQTAGAGPPHFRVHPYRAFREKLGDFQALSSLLRSRMEEAAQDWTDDGRAGDRAVQAQAEFDRLDALMLSLYVRTSRRYFTFLSFDKTIPLGALEWLRRDLPPLKAALEELSSPRLGRMLDPGLEAELTTAIMILSDLIARLPALPEFGARR